MKDYAGEQDAERAEPVDGHEPQLERGR
jgi:hypothetical protein